MWKTWAAAIGIFCVVLAIWFAGGYYTLTWAGKRMMRNPDFNPAVTGPLGDSFGAVSSLFAALGLAGVVFTILLQIKEQGRSDERESTSRKHAADLAMLASLVEGKAAASAYFSEHNKRTVDAYEACKRRIEELEAEESRFDLEMREINARQIDTPGPRPPSPPLDEFQRMLWLNNAVIARRRTLGPLRVRLEELDGEAKLARNKGYLAARELEALTLYAEEQLGRRGVNPEQGDQHGWAASKPEYMRRSDDIGYQSEYLPSAWRFPSIPRPSPVPGEDVGPASGGDPGGGPSPDSPPTAG